MINPNQLVSPAGQPGVMTATQDALNGAYSGSFATLDPSAMQPAPQYLGGSAIPSLGDSAAFVAPSSVSPQMFGVGGPITIMGTPDSLGPASALSGQSTAGDAGIMSGMGVGQVIASTESGTAPAASSDSDATAAPAPAAM